jgi:hypothetical protein
MYGEFDLNLYMRLHRADRTSSLHRDFWDSLGSS